MEIDYADCDIDISPDNAALIRKALTSVNGYPFSGKSMFWTFRDILGVVKRAEFLFGCWVYGGASKGDMFEAVSGVKGKAVRRATYVRIRKRADSWSLVSVSLATPPASTGGFCLVPYGKTRRDDLLQAHPELERISVYGNQKPLRADNRATRTRRSKAGKAPPATDAGPSSGDSAHEGQSVETVGGGGSQDAPGIVGAVPD